ncbi:MAG: LptA/OstA family protein [Verrucomicrobiota bacterium]
MPRWLYGGVFLLLLSSLGFTAQELRAQANSEGSTETGGVRNLEIQSDFSDYDQNLQIATATGDVIVTYGDVTIHADQVEFHKSTGNVFARDNVRVYTATETIDAEEIIYNIHTGEMTTSQFKSALEPIFYTSSNIGRPDENVEGPITLLNSTFTTHDSANPDFRVQVDKLEIYPDDKLVMRGARVHLGKVPVFYFPFYVQPLDEDLGYYFTPGWNSPWGAFLLNQYGFMVGDNVLAKAKLDIRSERGIAGGVEFRAQKFRSNPNIGRLNLYYANDTDPTVRFTGQVRADPPDADRYRLNFQHRIYFPGDDDETFYLDFDINKLSDAFIYEDFFPSEFRIDPKPDNLINLTKLFEQGEISLLWRGQLNEFFQTDTRSPEFSIDFIRTPIGDTGFYYNGMTTFGVIDEELDDASILAGMMEPSGYNRFQTYHEFLFPTQLAGFLNVVPRGGVGYANYSDFEIPGFRNFDSTTLHAGLDLSFKLSKRSPHVVNRALGLDGLLHVVQPYLNYSYVSTDEVSGRFTPIDRLTPSTRLRQIDLPLYPSVDDLRNWQIVRAGISQSWLTRRNGATYEWLRLNNYLDFYLNDPEFDRNVSNFFTEVSWHPLPWLYASSTAQLPLTSNVNSFSEVTTSLGFMPSDWFHVEFSHYYLNDHPFFADSSLYSVNTYTRLNDNWGFGTSHRFEADDGTLEYQQYSIHRDWGAWTATLGGIVRDNRTGENEYGVLFSLTLKAFPKIQLPVDFQPGSLGAEEN